MTMVPPQRHTTDQTDEAGQAIVDRDLDPSQLEAAAEPQPWNFMEATVVEVWKAAATKPSLVGSKEGAMEKARGHRQQQQHDNHHHYGVVQAARGTLTEGGKNLSDGHNMSTGSPGKAAELVRQALHKVEEGFTLTFDKDGEDGMVVSSKPVTQASLVPPPMLEMLQPDPRDSAAALGHGHGHDHALLPPPSYHASHDDAMLPPPSLPFSEAHHKGRRSSGVVWDEERPSQPSSGVVWDGVRPIQPSDDFTLVLAKAFSEQSLRARGLSMEDEEHQVYGKECFRDYTEGFHERLSKFWPNPREQLHAGGEEMTDKMVSRIQVLLSKPDVLVLDVCCGEGATVRKLAKDFPNARFVGIDIVQAAIQTARETCVSVPNATFVCGTIFSLPFQDCLFDVVYGQDPDGFSHPDRLHAFAECQRVLKPNGTFWMGHHWIPAADWSEEELRQYSDEDAALGWTLTNLSASSYLGCIKEIGLRDIESADMAEVAAEHFRATAEIMKRAQGDVTDKWLLKQLRYLDMGKKVCAFKQSVMQMMTAGRWSELISYVRTLTKDQALAERDENGFTLLHHAAKEGCMKMAEVLIHELKFDVDVLDDTESTPLYRALGYGQHALRDYLIKNGASLVHINGNKDNMLHNTTYVGDAEFSRVLIKGRHCDPFLPDKWNVIPLIYILDKIPEVAKDVFDLRVMEEFRHVQHRLLKFDFSGLEYGADMDDMISPIEKIVEEEHMDLLNHRLILAYFQLRWDAFARTKLYSEIFFYILDLAATTVISVLYKFRADNPVYIYLTVTASILLFIDTLRGIRREVRQNQNAKMKNQNIRFLRLFGFKKTSFSIKKYWFDLWNIYDVLTHTCGTIATLTIFITFCAYGTERFVTTNTWVIDALMILHVLLWTRSLKLVGVFKTTGPYIRTIIKMVADLFIFFSFYLVFWIGFTLAWYSKFSDDDIGNVWDVALMVLRTTTLGDTGVIPSLLNDERGLVPNVLFVLMLLLLPLMLTNLLIAMMNNSYSVVKYKAEEEWMVVWVSYIMEVTAEIDQKKLPQLLINAARINLENFPSENQTSLDVGTIREQFKEDPNVSFEWVDKALLEKSENASSQFSLLLLRDEIVSLIAKNHETVMESLKPQLYELAKDRNLITAGNSVAGSPRGTPRYMSSAVDPNDPSLRPTDVLPTRSRTGSQSRRSSTTSSSAAPRDQDASAGAVRRSNTMGPPRHYQLLPLQEQQDLLQEDAAGEQRPARRSSTLGLPSRLLPGGRRFSVS